MDGKKHTDIPSRYRSFAKAKRLQLLRDCIYVSCFSVLLSLTAAATIDGAFPLSQILVGQTLTLFFAAVLTYVAT